MAGAAVPQTLATPPTVTSPDDDDAAGQHPRAKILCRVRLLPRTALDLVVCTVPHLTPGGPAQGGSVLVSIAMLLVRRCLAQPPSLFTAHASSQAKSHSIRLCLMLRRAPRLCCKAGEAAIPSACPVNCRCGVRHPVRHQAGLASTLVARRTCAVAPVYDRRSRVDIHAVPSACRLCGGLFFAAAAPVLTQPLTMQCR